MAQDAGACRGGGASGEEAAEVVEDAAVVVTIEGRGQGRGAAGVFLPVLGEAAEQHAGSAPESALAVAPLVGADGFAQLTDGVAAEHLAGE